jgi:hypothetical protein
MKSDKLPAIQFYPGDWRKDPGIRTLSYHDRGVWFEILLMMHESDRRGVLLLNGRAMSDKEIALALGLDNQTFNQTLTTLLSSGVTCREEETGALMNRRMVRDEEIRKIRREAGAKGGNPRLLNQKSKQKPTTTDKQKSTPSSSSSASTKESQNFLKTGDRIGLENQVKALKEEIGKLKDETHYDWQRKEHPEKVQALEAKRAALEKLNNRLTEAALNV